MSNKTDDWSPDEGTVARSMDDAAAGRVVPGDELLGRLTQENEAPDTRGPAVVVNGSLLSGFKLTGPFETIEEASTWYKETTRGKLGVPCLIMLLEEPK